MGTGLAPTPQGPAGSRQAVHLLRRPKAAPTFLLMLIDFQLPLLLQPQRVDDGHGEPERFLGVAVGAQGVHPGTRSRDMLCKARSSRPCWSRAGRQRHHVPFGAGRRRLMPAGSASPAAFIALEKPLNKRNQGPVALRLLNSQVWAEVTTSLERIGCDVLCPGRRHGHWVCLGGFAQG